MPPSRLGFAVKVLAEPLKSHDARKWQSGPHLRTSLGYLKPIFAYLDRHDLRMYRMSSDLAPYLTHPEMPQFHDQIDEAAGELAEIGALANDLRIRLSFHPSQFVVINSPDSKLVAQSVRDLEAQAAMLDRMNQGSEAVVVVHVGGTYGDPVSSCRRWAATYKTLSESVRRRLVLEHDDLRFSAADVLAVHGETGVPLIFDHQHFWCLNPERLEMRETVEKFLRTWPVGVRPKVHYSSPRTELREITRKNRKTGKNETVLQPPVWTGHADFVNPFEFITFLRVTAGLEFDVMVEAKSKDLAVLRVRRDLPHYGPDTAERFGLTAVGVGVDREEGEAEDE